jgi:hypothetical protein
MSIVLAIAIAVPQNNCFAQDQLRIFEDINGGGSTSGGSGSIDNTFIYVAGGLLVAGVLAYALFLKNNDDEESDTTSVSSASKQINLGATANSVSEIEKTKDEIPLDIFFGIRNDESLRKGKTYLLGVSFKL